MADLIFVLIVVGFFAICVAYVRACDHIIGPDPAADGDNATSEGGSGPLDEADADHGRTTAGAW